MKHGNLDGSTLVKKEKEKDQLRMGGGSWSINLDELPETVLMIAYHTEDYQYLISRGDAFAHGFERTLGGERKLIVPLKHWRKAKK